jgi:hypothetical protein
MVRANNMGLIMNFKDNLKMDFAKREPSETIIFNTRDNSETILSMDKEE